MKNLESQIEFENKCKQNNYKYSICYDFKEFVRLVNDYMNLKEGY